MKKYFALLLSCIILLSQGMVTFAEENNLIRKKEHDQVKKIINEQKHIQKGIEKEHEI